ncbi:aluminum-activated malate transporter 9-like [Pyrus x bretschneideri]|uniref:aluminum-activated malate transporter 9-like n=1 Tax=Pyrus x bretschneideri TaxID=225117 RepID=UPI00203046D0|nr:aluminum-activated malate transporter 9-like [Pyrus x bretschneideri]
MNDKKGSNSSNNIEININIPCSVTKAKHHEKSSKGERGGGGGGGGEEEEGFPFKDWVWKVWKFAREDSNRVKFSLKVGLAVLLVSLLILFRAPYEVFGTNIIWSILTVAIMFEYTVGATFNRGFNRALGSLLAGVLAISVAQIALSSGRVAEPIIIGFSIFLIGTITSFMKLWPSLVPYEYGFRVVLFTYCLIVVSGYRLSMGNPMRTAMDRLYSIAIGGFVAVLVNVLVCPIWAGEQLHKELVNNFNSVADSLEDCVRKYLEDDGSVHPELSKTVMGEFPDEPAYRKCRSTLNSSAKLEALAVSAKWEPPHGRFKHFFYPWSEYVKVAAVLRYCAYQVMALHGVLHSEIQAPYNLRITFQSEIHEATSQAAELVRSLGQDISDMKRSTRTSLIKKLHSSTERLQRAIDVHSYLLTSPCDPPETNGYSKPLTKLSQTLSNNFSDLTSQLADLDSSNSLDKNSNQSAQQQQQTEPNNYHELMRKQSRRQHYSWPPLQVDAFEEEGSSGDFLPRMKALESTAALSLANFTSLLIEFVARLDHLVEAVDELSKLAKF